jgi:uncharacterized membrane protein
MREDGRSDLIVLSFEGADTADEVLTKLRGMQKEHLIDLEDACVIVRDAKGKVHIKQAVNLTALGAMSGASWGIIFGTLAGFLLLNPLAGLAIGGISGAGMGAISGSWADYGINDEFVRKLGDTITENSSALFVLVRYSTPDKILPEIEPFHPVVLRTSLSKQQEEKLKAALAPKPAAMVA